MYVTLTLYCLVVQLGILVNFYLQFTIRNFPLQSQYSEQQCRKFYRYKEGCLCTLSVMFYIVSGGQLFSAGDYLFFGLHSKI